jgi:superfamily II DNA/RNA helicase
VLRKSFRELLVSPAIVEKLALKEIVTPSALQESLIPVIHSHSDIFLKDETGSGKTLGIILGVLSKKQLTPLNPLLDLSKEDQEFAQRRLMSAKFVQTLILVPTRFS